MELISEDPTYLVAILTFAAAILFITLRITQQGKFLVMAASALGIAALILLVEKLWVTDAERVEARVYALGNAVADSNIKAVMGILSEDVEYVAGDNTMASVDTREMIKRSLTNAKFDFLRITKLRTNVGLQSRRGTADFHVICGGSFTTPFNDLNFGSANSTWSLAFKEEGANNWKVVRITPVYIPGGQGTLPTAKAPRPSSVTIPEFYGPRFGPGPQGPPGPPGKMGRRRGGVR